MKREIKFRAYYPYGDGDWIMLYNVQNTYDNTGNITDEHGKLACDPETCFADFIQGQDDGVELMQYTGIKDNNGWKIYEGDIVRTGKDNIGDPELMIGQVIMREGSWLIENEKMQEAIELFSEITSREVIGNIFENPELLEVPEHD